MLKISKNSWHYKIVQWGPGAGSRQKSLCTYFWTFIFTVVVLTVVSIIVGWLGFMGIGFLLDPFLTSGISLFTGVTPTHTFFMEDEISGHAFVPAVGLWTMVLLFATAYWSTETDAGKRFWEWIRARREKKKEGPLTGLQVFFKGISAMKRKVCPLVEYVDE